MATNYISAEIITSILQFIPLQQALQVSRVNKDFNDAVKVNKQYANRMAIRIQRAFRRWQDRRFLEEIGFSCPETMCITPPKIWIDFFKTSRGKRLGKALFKSYCTKFLDNNPDTDWGRIISAIVPMVTMDDDIPVSLSLIKKMGRIIALKKKITPAFHQEFASTLFNEVVIPLMEEFGYGWIYKTRVMFASNAPPIWSHYIEIDFDFNPVFS